MNYKIYSRELIKQFEFDIQVKVATTPFHIQARIFKCLDTNDEPFVWIVSHHYKLNEEDKSVYVPNNFMGNSIEEVETSLFTYINGFTNVGVTKNPYFL